MSRLNDPDNFAGRVNDAAQIIAIGKRSTRAVDDATSLIASKNLQLVAKSDHLKLQTGASSEAGKKAVKDGKKDFAYDPKVTEHRPEKRGILRRTEFMGGTGSNFGR